MKYNHVEFLETCANNPEHRSFSEINFFLKRHVTNTSKLISAMSPAQ